MHAYDVGKWQYLFALYKCQNQRNFSTQQNTSAWTDTNRQQNEKKHMWLNQIRLTVTVQIVYSASRRIITLFIKCWVNWYGISHRIGGLCTHSIHSTRSKAIILSKVSFLQCWIFSTRCIAENNITQINERTILHICRKEKKNFFYLMLMLKHSFFYMFSMMWSLSSSPNYRLTHAGKNKLKAIEIQTILKFNEAEWCVANRMKISLPFFIFSCYR